MAKLDDVPEFLAFRKALKGSGPLFPPKATNLNLVGQALSFKKNACMKKVFGALSDPSRRKIIELLHNEDSTLLELAHHHPVLSQALSKHIKILNDVNLVKKGKKANTGVNSLLKENTLKFYRKKNWYSVLSRQVSNILHLIAR